MKHIVLLFLTWLVAMSVPSVAQNNSEQEVKVVVIDKDKKKLPVFFEAFSTTKLKYEGEIWKSSSNVTVKVLQGDPELLSLGLHGVGNVISVKGKGLASWSVRQTEKGQRYLDLTAKKSGDKWPKSLSLKVELRSEMNDKGASNILLLGQGKAAGWSSQLSLSSESVKATSSQGFVPVSTIKGLILQSDSSGKDPGLVLQVKDQNNQGVDLSGLKLVGQVDEATESVSFVLTGEIQITEANALVPILSGAVAPTSPVSGGGRLQVIERKGGNLYELVFAKPGHYSVRLAFDAAIRTNEGWTGFNFVVPPGAVVPIVLQGLGEGVEFHPEASVLPQAFGGDWRGFLPASGAALLNWKRQTGAEEGALFFTTSELSEIRVGSGLLKQSLRVRYSVLQGSLNSLSLKLIGDGEILAVNGANATSWTVREEGGVRMLDVAMSRPISESADLLIKTQRALDVFPVAVKPLRVSPIDTVRHSGFLRVANQGAVRVEVADAKGMMQLSPEQFPAAAVQKGTRQVFAYRFPSAEYSYRIGASQILPEVSVSEVTIYEMTETDRVISASLELDIREAPLREWIVSVPANFAAASVLGAEVADYLLSSEEVAGMRQLKILFKGAVKGRHLVQLRLEKNQAAASGVWDLARLGFADAKVVRSQIAAVMTAGYRAVPADVKGLAEVPLTYFPKQVTGLQQAFRSKDRHWSASLKVEALGKNVQADVFHLYTLQEGVAYGSVVVNYFVAGAPANEWRLHVPESLGNVDVEGLNVSGSRREGDELIVSLRRVVMGASTLLVTFEQPLNAGGGVLNPGVVHPIGVQGERGYVQVVSQIQAKSKIEKATGNLLNLEASELPDEYRLLTTAPSMAAYQYAARPFDLQMSVEWYRPSELANQVVDAAWLESEVAEDGQVVTKARYFVKTRGSKSLRMAFPGGLSPWDVKVGGRTVNARRDGDETLIPLPATDDPNEVTEVVVRYGQTPEGGSKISLTAPVISAPTVMGRWTLKAVDGRKMLVPSGGDLEPTQAVVRPSGLSWMTGTGRDGLLWIVGLLTVAVILYRFFSVGSAMSFVGLFLFGLAAYVGVDEMLNSTTSEVVNRTTLVYATPAMPAGEGLEVVIRNTGKLSAMASIPGVIIAILGLAALGFSLLKRGKSSLLSFAGMAVGLLLLIVGILMQANGQTIFLGLISAVLVGVTLRGAWQWFFIIKERLQRPKENEEEMADVEDVLPEPDSPSGGSTIASWAIILGLTLGLGLGSDLQAKDESMRAVDAAVQTVKIEKGRLYGEIDLSVTGGGKSGYLLLRHPAVLTSFVGQDLSVVKRGVGDSAHYYVVSSSDDVRTAKVTYEIPAANFHAGVKLPTGPAVVQNVSISLDQAGWVFSSGSAVSVRQVTGKAGMSQATLVLTSRGSPQIRVSPKARDVSAEETKFFIESSDLYVPRPGVVSGRHRVLVRPSQGQLSELEMKIPKPFMVGAVQSSELNRWRFDPETGLLRITLKRAKSNEFALYIDTQSGAGSLPTALSLSPVKVTGAAGEVGMLALGFGTDAQPETVTPNGLSLVNLQDFPQSLLPRNRKGKALALLHKVYRYGAKGGSIDVRVTDVAPEVRVRTKQVLSLGDDQLVLSVDLAAQITRAGVFQLSFPMPKGMELESASGAALSHWTEAKEGAVNIVTLHLNGRTLGNQNFALSFSGQASGPQNRWEVPGVSLLNVARLTGEYHINPGQGIRIRAVDRDKVSQLENGGRSGSLSFRLLQSDWKLLLGVEKLDPWVTVQALQEIHLREGQTLQRATLNYSIQNAAVKTVKLRLPDLSEEAARTVRVSGKSVKNITAVAGEPGMWAVEFKRAVAGEVSVILEYQSSSAQDNTQAVLIPLGFPDVRKVSFYCAVRSSARMELNPLNVSRNWQAVDWAVVPSSLKRAGSDTVPSLCYRVTDQKSQLAVSLKRHAVADSLKLRVKSADLMTIFSSEGPSLTAMDLDLEVSEKSTLKLRLPEGAELFSAFVNREGVAVVRDGENHLFYVTGGDNEHAAKVRLVYSSPAKLENIQLSGPQLSIPLENVTWNVMLPEGYDLSSYHGLELMEANDNAAFGLKSYLKGVAKRKRVASQLAQQELQQANRYLRQGDQAKATWGLRRAASNFALDAATNEDARVQLKVLKTEQAVLGLNTRRQKLYLDNKFNDTTVQNDQLELGVRNNPLFNGKENYQQRDLDAALLGNTSEENASLSKIAKAIVAQQLASEPSPVAIDIDVPRAGRVFTFTRRVQVDGGQAMAIDLDLSTQGEPEKKSMLLILGLLIVLSALLGLMVSSKKRA